MRMKHLGVLTVIVVVVAALSALVAAQVPNDPVPCFNNSANAYTHSAFFTNINVVDGANMTVTGTPPNLTLVYAVFVQGEETAPDETTLVMVQQFFGTVGEPLTQIVADTFIHEDPLCPGNEVILQEQNVVLGPGDFNITISTTSVVNNSVCGLSLNFNVSFGPTAGDAFLLTVFDSRSTGGDLPSQENCILFELCCNETLVPSPTATPSEPEPTPSEPEPEPTPSEPEPEPTPSEPEPEPTPSEPEPEPPGPEPVPTPLPPPPTGGGDASAALVAIAVIAGIFLLAVLALLGIRHVMARRQSGCITPETVVASTAVGQASVMARYAVAARREHTTSYKGVKIH